jgi:hypothetical protein
MKLFMPLTVLRFPENGKAGHFSSNWRVSVTYITWIQSYYENRIITDDSTCPDPFIGRDLTELYDCYSESIVTVSL